MEGSHDALQSFYPLQNMVTEIGVEVHLSQTISVMGVWRKKGNSCKKSATPFFKAQGRAKATESALMNMCANQRQL